MPQAREEVNHPLFARLYMWMSSGRRSEEDEHRRKLLAGLRGRVIELGCGNGLNFPHYPETVEEVVAVEPEPRLREAALAAAAETPVPIHVVDAVAASLPMDDESFDAGVASLVLCSVADPALALAELRRVIRSGGELRFYEHVIARKAGLRRMQRFADATFWPHVGGGCHLARDTGAEIERAGFQIEAQERFPFSPGAAIPSIPHILGVARRP